jgi:hypothetical protein
MFIEDICKMLIIDKQYKAHTFAIDQASYSKSWKICPTGIGGVGVSADMFG